MENQIVLTVPYNCKSKILNKGDILKKYGKNDQFYINQKGQKFNAKVVEQWINL